MLKGIRIVDFTRYLPGPYATLRLADMGAEVIKVEAVGSGDPARSLGNLWNGTGLLYLANNRNKKSVTVNLKKKEGQDLAFQLACQADVVVEGFRPGVAQSLGIGYERLKEKRPDIIYCSLSGYGQTGSLRDLAGHDLNYISLSGLLSQLKDKRGKPIQPGIQFADMIGGIVTSEAILAALIQRGTKSKGAYLDLSLTESVMGMMAGHVMMQQLLGLGNGLPMLSGEQICYTIYETRDGRFVSLAALEKKFWLNFCRGVGREDWVTAHMSKTEEENPIFLEVQSLFKSRTWEEWAMFSQEVDCCLTPVMEIADLHSSSYVKERGLAITQYTDPWGALHEVATSAGGNQMYEPGNSQQQVETIPLTPPPFLGEHNREIFKGLLHATDEQINSWQQRGII